MSEDIIKTAARQLQSRLQAKFKLKLQSAHAHALISAYLGFKSKKALIAYTSNQTVTDPFFLLSGEWDTSESTQEIIISQMKDAPFKSIPPLQLIEEIKNSLMPVHALINFYKNNILDLYVVFPDEIRFLTSKNLDISYDRDKNLIATYKLTYPDLAYVKQINNESFIISRPTNKDYISKYLKLCEDLEAEKDSPSAILIKGYIFYTSSLEDIKTVRNILNIQ